MLSTASATRSTNASTTEPTLSSSSPTPSSVRCRPFSCPFEPPTRAPARMGSFYVALAHGRIDAEVLRNLLARHPLAGSGATPVYAVGMSVAQMRRGAQPLTQGYYYHPSCHSAGQPIVAGWAYQFIAQLNFVCESWTAPLDVERVRPAKDANEVAAKQVKVLLGRRSCCVYARSARNPLERVMNSIRN